MSETAIFYDFEPRRKGKGKRCKGEKASGSKMALIADTSNLGEQTRQRPVAVAESVSESANEKSALSEVSQEASDPEAVMVKVRRVCANPRLVECVYSEGGIERRVLVRVGRNANFVRGMELEARRGQKESDVWGYAGALPRLRGRW